MARGNDSGVARRARALRSTGFLSLVAGMVSAAALTGAAVYTVGHATCGSPAQYIRHDNHVELVGGCVDGSELPAVPAGSDTHNATAGLPGVQPHGNKSP